MDNPAAVLTDDVVDWTSRAPSSGSIQPQKNIRLSSGSDINHSTKLSNNSPQTPSHQKQQQHQQPTPQQHYRRNASTYSIDIPATLGLMVTSGNPTANEGSTTSST